MRSSAYGDRSGRNANGASQMRIVRSFPGGLTSIMGTVHGRSQTEVNAPPVLHLTPLLNHGITTRRTITNRALAPTAITVPCFRSPRRNRSPPKAATSGIRSSLTRTSRPLTIHNNVQRRSSMAQRAVATSSGANAASCTSAIAVRCMPQNRAYAAQSASAGRSGSLARANQYTGRIDAASSKAWATINVSGAGAIQ